MKQPKKSKADTSPITITCTLTKEEIERFSEEWAKVMNKQQPVMIHKDADLEPINVEPTEKEEMVEGLDNLFIETNRHALHKYHHNDFNNINKVHDWKNYVPEVLIKGWHDLTEREKEIIFIITAQQADKEEWN